ncbi:AMP-binding protein [Streptomyces sp. NPDC006184]|uniref:AMP-binding protein n=1 Tax=Streptomyces sp. NPDC006184 TaxID=3155455 RepID=UPI00339F10F0
MKRCGRATLVVATRAALLRPVRFAATRALTHWNSVPSVIPLAERLRALKPAACPLRRSVFCGEPLTLRQARAWALAAPNSTVDHAYGPTELTVTWWPGGPWPHRRSRPHRPRRIGHRRPRRPRRVALLRHRPPAPRAGGLEGRLLGGELCVRG